MKCLEKQMNKTIPQQAGSVCPKGVAPLQTAVPAHYPAKRSDRVTFGMKLSVKEGCCVEKLKTGRIDGCCNHISTEKHLENFKNAVQVEFESTGIKPPLDEHTRAILEGKIKPGEPYTPPIEKKPTVAADKPKEPWITRIILTPYRFFKWLIIGFYKDMKQLFTGKEVK